MNDRILPYIIALSALLVSGSAAFYSVNGIGKMFAGASTEVMIMAGSLEFAKIVIASMLHRYWGSINKLLRIYFLISIFVLIAITSAGIYGFLSSAYQETAFKLENGTREIELIEGEKRIIQSEIENIERQLRDKNERISSFSKIRIDQQNSQGELIKSNKSTKSINSQIKGIEDNIKSIDEDIKILNDSLSSKNRQIAIKDSEIMRINSNKEIAQEIGPIKYISEITGRSLSTVVNWYIIALMLVFDPLAISLVVAANFAFTKKREETESVIEENVDSEEKIAEEKIEEEKIDGVEINNHRETSNDGHKEIESESDRENITTEIQGEASKNADFSGYKSNGNIILQKTEDPTRLR